MALKDMISDIEQAAMDDINQSIAHAKVEAAKKIFAKASILEDSYNKKKDILSAQLSKKEISLKSEKDFFHRNQQLREADEFMDDILPIIRSSLLTFVSNQKYSEILGLWLNQITNSIDVSNSYLYINSRDIELIHQNVSSISNMIKIVADDTIEAGFIVETDNETTINLSFGYLFEEQKSKILHSVLLMLKEEI